MLRPFPLSAFSQTVRLALRLAAAGSVISMLAVWGAAAQQTASLGEPVLDFEAAAAADGTGQSAEEAADAQAAADENPFEETDEADPDDQPARPASATPRAPSPRALGAGGESRAASAPRPGNDDADRLSAPGAADAADNLRTAREATELNDAGGRAEHALAIEALPRGDAVDIDPYQPLGIRAGGFVLRPSVETGLTATSNAARTPNGSSGVLSETTVRLGARSDWAEHLATVDGYGTVRRSLSGDDDVQDVEGGIDAALQFDLGDEWQARGGLAYTVRPESASARDAVVDAEEQPLRHQFRAEAGLGKELGRVRLGGTVSVERDWYGDAELEGGGTIDQSERNSTLGLVTLRAGYALSPALTPFVEVEGGRRAYDEAGDADRIGARAGVALDLQDKLSGEVAAGWLRESFDDGDFDPIEGPSLVAGLRWSPVRETVVALNAATTVDGTATEGESGSLVQDLRLEIERALRANLTAEAGLGASIRDYSGSDAREVTLVGDIGATWWLNRQIGLSGRLRHERLESNLPDRDYSENSVFLGTKFQY